jgi:hypothetical protein
MAERAFGLLQDRDAYARMQRSAAARALQFSADKIVPRYEQIYEEVLA